MAANTHTLRDEDGEYSDWIELYNRGATRVDLLDWSLTDSAANLAKWRFPATNIAPGQYLVVFASSKDRRIPGAPLHTNFKLDPGGEYLALVDATGTNIVSQFAPRFAPQIPDIAYGFSAQWSTTNLLTQGSPVRMLVPRDGSLGLNWTLADFNDSAWQSGLSGVGYETGELESPASAASAAVLAAGPAGYWRLQETTGANALDSSGVSVPHPGALLNGVRLGLSGPQGAAFPGFETNNRAARFDGLNDKIDIPYAPSLNPPVFTVSCWARVVAGLGAYRSPLTSRADNPQRGYLFYSSPANQWEFWIGAGQSPGWISLTGPAVQSSVWTHLAGTFDGATVRFYVNGAPAGTPKDTPFAPNSTAPLRIGAGSSETAGNFYFNGDIDEVAVFGRALADAEIQQLYLAATQGGPGPSVTNQFHYADLIQSDLRPAMFGVNASAWLRWPFNITDPSQVDTLTLRLKYDDGFVAYLNGELAAEALAPASPQWNSAATGRRAADASTTFQEYSLTDMRGWLRPGANVLAIHGLNYGATNADFLILPELVMTALGPLSTEPRFFLQPTPGAANSRGAADLGPLISQVGNTPALPARPATNNPIVVTARVAQAFVPLAAVTLKWRVMFGVTNQTPMLDDGAHGDGAAGDGIYGAIIPAGAAKAGQMVRWSVAATDAAGHASRWPLFDEPLNSPQYLGTVITNPAVRSLLPIFEWFAADSSAAHARTGARGAVFFKGRFYDNVFIRQRGGYTVQVDSQKFDFNSGDHCFIDDVVGEVEELNLNGKGSDPSDLRQPMAYQSFRDVGGPASASAHFYMRVNGNFDRVGIFIEQVDERFLRRWGLNDNGALYKFVQRGNLNPSFYDTNWVEKKIRLHEGFQDLQAVVTGLARPTPAQRQAFLFDNLKMAQVINYLAERIVIQDVDSVRKNFYLYRDADGDREWQIFPWDKDWTFGVGEGGAGPNYAHPFLGTQAYLLDPGNHQYSVLFDVMFYLPATRELYMRRLRTRMDEELQPLGTPTNQLIFEARVRQWWQQAGPSLTANESNAVFGGGGLYSWFNVRRQGLYVTYAATNLAAAITNRLIPPPQPPNVAVLFGGLEFNPPSGNQAQEYVCLTNPAPFAVDLSGWEVAGAIQHRFPPGTVIGSNNVLYLSPDVVAFRARTAGPRGGQGLYVQGGYHGQLSARGEALELLDPAGRRVSATTYTGAPSPAQQYLRITELMYHPAPQSGYAGSAEDFEYIKLKNIGPDPLNLLGVHFGQGVEFAFTNPAAATLGPGQTLVLAKNPAAFALRYGALPNVVPYAGSLDNAGERLQLLDARNEEILDFSFRPDWHPLTDGFGFSLVVVDETAEPDLWNSRSNWRASGRLGGSPGAPDPGPPPLAPILINEVLTRSDVPPPADSVELFNPTASPVDLSHWLLTDDFRTPAKFPIPNGTMLAPGGCVVFTEADFNPGGNGFAFSALGDEACLFSADAQGNLTGYYHGFDFGAGENGVTFGRYLTSDGEEEFVAQVRPTLGSTNAGPRVGPIVISEIMYHPDAAGSAFLELYNIGIDTVPLFDPAAPANTWRLAGEVDFAFPTNLSLAPGKFLVVAGFDPAAATNLTAFRAKYNLTSTVPVHGPWQGKLPNDNGRLKLTRPAAPLNGSIPYVLVEQVHYRDEQPWPAGADGTGLSLQRKDPAQYGNDPANWTAAPPTAGALWPAGGTPPTITLQPQSETWPAGSRVLLFVSAAGTAPLQYQWRRNGTPVPGATNSALVLTNLQWINAGDYSVLIFNRSGSTATTNAQLTVVLPPTIMVQPQSLAVRVGTNATLSVVAYSPYFIRYQWRFNGADLPGATTANLSFTNVDTAQNGTYSVVVSNAEGSVASIPASLLVLAYPVITQQPVSMSVPQGGSATLSVAVTNNATLPIGYRWRRNGLTYKNLLLSERQAFLTLTNLQATTTIDVIVTNLAYAAGYTSTRVTLTVLPDADNDGLPDAWELQYGLNPNSPADAQADSDGDTMTNWQEYIAGTDPTDPSSYLKLDAIATSPSEASLQFMAVSNRTYTVEFTDALGLRSWSKLADLPALPTNYLEILTIPASATNRYYRLLTPRRP
jgi:hypothetical protein